MADPRKRRAGLARRPRALSLVPAASHAAARAALLGVVEAMWPQVVELAGRFAAHHDLPIGDVAALVVGPEAIGGQVVGTFVAPRAELFERGPLRDATLERCFAMPPPDGHLWFVVVGCGVVVGGAAPWRAEFSAPGGCA